MPNFFQNEFSSPNFSCHHIEFKFSDFHQVPSEYLLKDFRQNYLSGLYRPFARNPSHYFCEQTILPKKILLPKSKAQKLNFATFASKKIFPTFIKSPLCEFRKFLLTLFSQALKTFLSEFSYRLCEQTTVRKN